MWRPEAGAISRSAWEDFSTTVGDKQNPYRLFAVYGSIIFLLPSSLLGGWWLGSMADDYFGTDPWAAVTGIFLGAAGGFIEVFRLLSPSGKKPRHKGTGR